MYGAYVSSWEWLDNMQGRCAPVSRRNIDERHLCLCRRLTGVVFAKTTLPRSKSQAVGCGSLCYTISKKVCCHEIVTK